MSAGDGFEQVLLRGTTLAGVLHLSWVAPEQGDRLVRVYVNGRLYDVSMDASQREMWLQIGGQEDVSVTLVMVDAERAWTDQSQRGVSEPAMVRDEAWPIDARAVVMVDGVDVAEAAVWGAGDFRSGFGGLFGEGEFGRDAASAPGLGLGEFGVGPIGMDAAAWRWDGRLESGAHEVALRVVDGAGRTIAQMDGPRMVEVDRLPADASGVAMDETFTLHITP